MERAPEQTLDLQFQSQTEETEEDGAAGFDARASFATSSLPALQSEIAGSAEVEALTGLAAGAAPKSAAKVESAPAVEARRWRTR